MKGLKNILEIYQRNKWLIIGVLALLMFLQWCHVNTNNKYQGSKITSEQIDSLKAIKATNQPAPAPAPPEPWYVSWLSYFIMVGLVFLVFIAQRRKWFVKLVPRFAIVRASVKRHRTTKRRMLHVTLISTKLDGQTFDLPTIEFMKLGQTKSFRIKVADDAIAFPITLTQNTSHKIVIDLDQFYDKVVDLKQYRWVRLKVTVNGQSIKKSAPQLARLF